MSRITRLIGATLLPISLPAILTCSYRVPNRIEPHSHYTVRDRYLKSLPSPFPPLTLHEKEMEWGREYKVGEGFAKDLDLYRAITSFRRAEYLMPTTKSSSLEERRRELRYRIMLCYYFGKRYEEVIATYNRSPLHQVGPDFPLYHDLLVMLYESYKHIDEPNKAEFILRLIGRHYKNTAERLKLGVDLTEGDLSSLHTRAEPDFLSDAEGRKELTALLHTYAMQRKSVRTAENLNLLLPGMGYLYIGQKQSALTAFLLNSLFITAAVQFFRHHHIAAGIITTSVEAGWYLGGVYGAGEAAKFYNERRYEELVRPLIAQHHLVPVLTLEYAF
ncbi:MAG: tetratricopeptide repeat protein [Simkaniaceae bacterium]|nr:tetratricopeptide repeat protein [Simkaniaceae bacterium]